MAELWTYGRRLTPTERLTAPARVVTPSRTDSDAAASLVADSAHYEDEPIEDVEQAYREGRKVITRRPEDGAP
jgi:hypothetical protein